MFGAPQGLDGGDSLLHMDASEELLQMDGGGEVGRSWQERGRGLGGIEGLALPWSRSVCALRGPLRPLTLRVLCLQGGLSGGASGKYDDLAAYYEAQLQAVRLDHEQLEAQFAKQLEEKSAAEVRGGLPACPGATSTGFGWHAGGWVARGLQITGTPAPVVMAPCPGPPPGPPSGPRRWCRRA